MNEVEVLKCMRRRVENLSLNEENEENENIIDFINLAIRVERTQSLVCGRWETMEYALFYNSSEGVVRIDESGFQCGREFLPHTNRSKEKYEMIEELLNEIP